MKCVILWLETTNIWINVQYGAKAKHLFSEKNNGTWFTLFSGVIRKSLYADCVFYWLINIMEITHL